MKDKTEVKKLLLDFTVTEVEKFLSENPNLTFYGFAYDCGMQHTSVGLCFNTEEGFEQIIEAHYQYEKTEEETKSIRFNTGDWEYQNFGKINVHQLEELDAISDIEDDYKTWDAFQEEFLDTLCECLIEFSKTETFNKIPKTDDFLFFSIEHDEELEEAMIRMERLQMAIS